MRTEAHAQAGELVTLSPSEIRPGYLTSEVHPGDPVQTAEVLGFSTHQEALRFVSGGFLLGESRPVFRAILTRGQSVRFAPASYLVIFYRDTQQQPVLMAIARCHGDLHLVLGSCGYQLVLFVRTQAAPPPPPPREPADR